METSGGSETVVISDNAPSSPNDGDLWWESDTGQLKIYYNDGDSQQWVDANAGVLSSLTVWQTNSAGINTTSNVGIGTTNVSAVDSNNTAVLAVGIVTANKYYGDGSNLTGVPGSSGAQGATGAVGAQGASGSAGSAGAQGAVGAQGAAGSATSTNVIAPFAYARVFSNSSGSGTNISWTAYDSSTGFVDFTFSTAQGNTNYYVEGDRERFDQHLIDVVSKTTTGFRTKSVSYTHLTLPTKA